MSVVSPTVGLCTAGDSDIDDVSSDEEDVEEGGEADEDDADSGDERGAAAKVCPCVWKLDANPALEPEMHSVVAGCVHNCFCTSS